MEEVRKLRRNRDPESSHLGAKWIVHSGQREATERIVKRALIDAGPNGLSKPQLRDEVLRQRTDGSDGDYLKRFRELRQAFDKAHPGKPKWNKGGANPWVYDTSTRRYCYRPVAVVRRAS